MNKIQYFYFSPTSTTKKVLEGIVKGTGYESVEHNLTMIAKNLDEYVVEKDEIAIVGVPVYAGRVPEVILDTLKRIKGNGGVAIAVVTYGNRAFDDALLELKDILKGQNFNVIAGGAFIGEHSYTKKVATNRPDESDMEKAEYFGKKIVAKLEEKDFNEIIVPGKFPYKERKPKSIFAPHGNRSCVYCRHCPVACPVGAIDMRKPDIVDEEKCIHCCACIKVCTFNGRELLDEGVLGKIKWLEENCQERKEPQIFI